MPGPGTYDKRGRRVSAPKRKTPKRIADPKTRAKAPPTKRPAALRPGLPQVGSTLEGARRTAQRKHGEALARTPGVKARLRPQRKGASPDEKTRGAFRGAKGLSTEERRAIAVTRTPAGRALREAQAVSDAEYARQVRRYGLPRNPPAKKGKPRKRIGIGPASVDITHTGAAIADRIAAGHGRGLSENVVPFIGRGVDDARRLPVDAAKSLYEHGAAAVEAAQGDTARAKRVLKGYTEGVIGKAVQGDFEGALETFSEHPLYGALELSGGYAVVGRAGGAAARSGALGRRAKRAGSTTRDDLRVAPGISAKRSYSKNIITAGVQRRREAAARRRGEDPNEAKPSRIPFRGREHLIRKHADEFNSVAETRRRHGREVATREAMRALPTRKQRNLATRRGRVGAAVERARSQPRATIRGRLVTTRPEQFVMGLVAERVRRKADVIPTLRAERARLETVYRGERPTMSERAQRLNRQQAAALDAFLRSPRAVANADGLWAAVGRYDRAINPRTKKLVQQGVLEPGQARNAILRPTAVTDLGGRYDPSKRVHPADAARARQAREGARTARQAARSAQEAHARARIARREIIVKRRASSGAVGRMDDVQYAAELANAERRVQAARTARTDADRTANEAARTAQRSRARPTTVGLVDAQGVRMSAADIDARLKAQERGNPVDRQPSFVGQSDRTRGARAAFVQSFGGRGQLDTPRRTGEASRLGAVDPHPARLVDTIVRAQGVIDSVTTWDRFVGQYGARHPDGRPFTPAEAEAFISSQPPGAVKMVPVRLTPARYSAERAEQITGALQRGLPLPDDFLTELVNERFERATVAVDDLDSLPADTRLALVPEEALTRMAEHQNRASSAPAKVAQKLTATFRGVVLPFSTKWITGNIVEAVLRLAAEGSIPVYDALIGRRLVREMIRLDEERLAHLRRGFDTGEDFGMRTGQGLLYGTHDNLTIHRDRTALEGTGAEPVGKAMHVLAETPPLRIALAGLHGYQRLIFGLNKGIENQMIRHATGKLARRQVQEFSGSWLRSLRMGEDAVRDVARGLLDSDAQAAYARSIDEILGQYQRFSPDVKRTIQTVAPFLPWYLNAVRFVYYTLPAKHPIKTALLARTNETFQQDYDEDNKDLPPGDLRAAIRRPDGGLVNVARYMPFGAFTGPFPGLLLDPIFPQFSSAWEIAHGRSWTGKQLQLEPGPGGKRKEVDESDKAWLALYSFAESTWPGVQLGRRLQEGGNTPYDDSTIFDPKTKPNTSYGATALDRVFDPFRPTFLRKPRGRGLGAVAPATPSSDPVERALEAQEAAGSALDDPRLDEQLDRLLGGE